MDTGPQPHVPPITETSAGPARSASALAVDRVFGAYLAGKLLSTAGIWIHNIVAALVMYDLTDSAFMVGAVSIAQFAPQLLSPIAGAFADRGDRRRQAISGRLISAFGSATLAVWIWVAGSEGLGGPAPLLAVSLIVGIGFVVGGPALHAIIPSMVRQGELPTAMALSNIPFTVSRTAAPALGAGVALWAGPAVAFGLAACGSLAFAGALTRVPREGNTGRREGSFSVLAGVRHIRRDRPLLVLLLGVAAIGAGSDPVLTLGPSLAESVGRSREFAGVIASCFGVGAGVALALTSLARRWLGLAGVGALGLAFMGAGLVGASVARDAIGAIATFALVGAGMSFATTSSSTLIQLRTPDELRGRVMAMWSLAMVGSRPLAAAFNGATTDAMSLEAALASSALLLFAAAFACRPSRVGGERPHDLPARSTPGDGWRR